MAQPSHQRGNRLAPLHHVSALVSKAPRRVRFAAPLAVAATVGAVVLGTTVVSSEVPAPTSDIAGPTTIEGLLDERDADTSRSAERQADLDAAWNEWETSSAAVAQHQADAAAAAQQQSEATAAAIAGADTSRWSTADLDLHATAAEGAEVLGLLEEGTEVLVTGRATGGREEVVIDGESRWVTAGHLTDEDPAAVEETPDADSESESAGSGGASSAPAGGGSCTTSSTPSGVSANIAALHDAVCAKFPDITNYGGYRGDGDHGKGLALDIMVRGDRGWQIAEYIRDNYTTWNVNYVIYEQKIWSVERSGEGWRPMSDRGGDTANHYDHVHVSVY